MRLKKIQINKLNIDRTALRAAHYLVPKSSTRLDRERLLDMIDLTVIRAYVRDDKIYAFTGISLLNEMISQGSSIRVSAGITTFRQEDIYTFIKKDQISSRLYLNNTTSSRRELYKGLVTLRDDSSSLFESILPSIRSKRDIGELVGLSVDQVKNRRKPDTRLTAAKNRLKGE